MSRQRPTAAPETHETRWARPTIFGKPGLLTNAPTQLGGGAHVSGDRFGFQELGGTPQGRRDRHRHRCSAQSPFPHPACLVHRGQASPLGTGGVTGPLRTASDESWRKRVGGTERDQVPPVRRRGGSACQLMREWRRAAGRAFIRSGYRVTRSRSRRQSCSHWRMPPKQRSEMRIASSMSSSTGS